MRAYLAKNLPHIWQDKTHPVSKLLFPLSLLYGLVMKLRRMMYQSGLMTTTSVDVPVVVVGNISVGGTGKTPLVVWLNEYAKRKGLKTGIISRGYGGSSPVWPVDVSAFEKTEIVGDEAVMLRKKTNSPVVVSPVRSEAAQMLIEKHAVDFIISDDGLQHLALDRDLEVIVVDAKRLYGNNRLLPSGPLREPISTISDQAIQIFSSTTPLDDSSCWMQFQPIQFRSVKHPEQILPVNAFEGSEVNAVAGIGYPDKFFLMLKRLGITITTNSFADHHIYQRHDLVFNNQYPILMTEKDAVKCQPLVNENSWYLEITAQPNHLFKTKMDQFIRTVKNKNET